MSEIGKLAERFGKGVNNMAELERKAIADGTTPAEFQGVLLDAVDKRMSTPLNDQSAAADIGWMSFGFWLALRLPVRVTVALAVIGELVAGYVVRDNLTLNVIMLLFPLDAIAQWQAAGGVA